MSLFGAIAASLIAAGVPASLADGASLSGRAHAPAPYSPVTTTPTPGLAAVVVHSQFGGQIFGFDIVPEGNEGVLSEAQALGDGTILAAVETFNQSTGEIISVLARTPSEDDYITLGLVGHNFGLVEYEHEVAPLHFERTFQTINPLSANRFTGHWNPPIDDHHLIEAVSRNHATNTFVAYAYDNSESFEPQVFLTNLEARSFGPLIVMTDESFQTGLVPKLAYNDSTKRALLGIQTIGNPFIPPTFALVDVLTGTTTMFSGVGIGDVNGLAIDPATNIACSTTEIDFSVQFYDVSTLSGASQALPGATNQFYSGADVAVDPIHHLFLVAHPNSSTAGTGSSIHVYDEAGNLIESLNGFNFSNAGNVVPMHIALHPAVRLGFVDGPDPSVREIQSFNY
jgi:hypothetical protein